MKNLPICNECNKTIHTIESLHVIKQGGDIKFYHKKCYDYANSAEKRNKEKEKNIRKSDIYYIPFFEELTGLYKCRECGDKYDSLYHAAIHFKTVHREAMRRFIDTHCIETYQRNPFAFYDPIKYECKCKICGNTGRRESIRAHVFNTHFRGGEVKAYKHIKIKTTSIRERSQRKGPKDARYVETPLNQKLRAALIKKSRCLKTRKDVRTLIKQNEMIEKPWKDPESLFCDTSFLTTVMNFDVREGDECKG